MISSEMAGEWEVKNVCSAPAGVLQICHEPLEASPWEVSSIMRQKLVYLYQHQRKATFWVYRVSDKHPQDTDVVQEYFEP